MNMVSFCLMSENMCLIANEKSHNVLVIYKYITCIIYVIKIYHMYNIYVKTYMNALHLTMNNMQGPSPSSILCTVHDNLPGPLPLLPSNLFIVHDNMHGPLPLPLYLPLPPPLHLFYVSIKD